MQISASTLLASQQVGQVQAKPVAPPTVSFTQALEKTPAFQPLELKQTAPAQDIATGPLRSAPKGPQRLGSTIDIKV